MNANSNPASRSTAPVFVLGSPRSGTTLLYDMLLSAGGFAIYLAESNVFNVLAPNFGNLKSRGNRQKLLEVWLHSKLFRATGLDAQQIEKEVLERCENPGDFLRIVMGGIARAQGAQRWAENSPEGILHLPLIKRCIPEALVIHTIRDGRDVAMSLSNTRYLQPFPWQDRISLTGAGVYWDWIVQRGHKYGQQLGPDYMEVHFEDLVAKPQETLQRLGRFIDHELDYERIREVGYGSVSRPNTSFRGEARENFNPVGRWKKGFSAEQVRRFESMLGKSLTGLGYSLSGNSAQMTAEMKATRWAYRRYFEGKLWLKQQPLMRLLRPLTAARVDAMVLAEDHPPELKVQVSSASPQRGGPR